MKYKIVFTNDAGKFDSASRYATEWQALAQVAIFRRLFPRLRYRVEVA